MLPARRRLSFICCKSFSPPLFLPVVNEVGRPIRLCPRAEGGLDPLIVTFDEGGGGRDLFVEKFVDDTGRGGCKKDVGDELPDPREERLTPGPTDRLPAGIPLAYIPEVGMGRNVGVDGREVGVGMELVVETVLVLSRPSEGPDRRD